MKNKIIFLIFIIAVVFLFVIVVSYLQIIFFNPVFFQETLFSRDFCNKNNCDFSFEEILIENSKDEGDFSPPRVSHGNQCYINVGRICNGVCEFFCKDSLIPFCNLGCYSKCSSGLRERCDLIFG